MNFSCGAFELKIDSNFNGKMAKMRGQEKLILGFLCTEVGNWYLSFKINTVATVDQSRRKLMLETLIILNFNTGQVYTFHT